MTRRRPMFIANRKWGRNSVRVASIAATIALFAGVTPVNSWAAPPPSFESPFSANDPFKTAIPASAVVDPSSAALVAHNIGHSSVIYVNAYSGARTFYQSGPNDPSYNVTFKNVPAWGPNPFDKDVTATTGLGRCNPLHVPADAARPHSRYDRWMAIVDSTKPGLICEIWRADKSTGTWTGDFGGVSDINAMGNHSLGGFLTGSGISTMEGVIRASEIRSGVINHALVFAGGCNIRHQHRYPAAGSDGTCSDPMGFVEGMHFQLDPSFDCNAVPVGIPRMICVALQVYGAYDGDNTGGEPNTKYVAFIMETDDRTDPKRSSWERPGNYVRPGGLYTQNGVPRDFYQIPSIPLDRLRLLLPPNQQIAPSRAR